MKTSIRSITSTAALGLVVGATQAFALPVNITRLDNNTTAYGFSGNALSGVNSNIGSLGAAGSASRGNFGVGLEDNETEPGTISGQTWDMEAFVLNGKKLSIVSGFNLLNGNNYHNVGAGDLFIKVGGAQPLGLPTVNLNGAGTINNNVSAGANYPVPYGYTHVVDLSLESGVGPTTKQRFNNTSFGTTAKVYSLAQTGNVPVLLSSTEPSDAYGSNPWKYLSGGTLLGNTTLGDTANGLLAYETYQTDNSTDLQTLGLGGLIGGTGASWSEGTFNANPALNTLTTGFYGHNILTIDLSFLGNVGSGTPIWFSYTMQCGNDSIKGRHIGGLFQVPDASSSLLLIALGFASIALFVLKRR